VPGFEALALINLQHWLPRLPHCRMQQGECHGGSLAACRSDSLESWWI